MMVSERGSSRFLNFLIDELSFAGIPFQFATPLQGDMHWRNGEAVSLVSSVVAEAKELGGTVMIGAIDGSEISDTNNGIFFEIAIDS